MASVANKHCSKSQFDKGAEVVGLGTHSTQNLFSGSSGHAPAGRRLLAAKRCGAALARRVPRPMLAAHLFLRIGYPAENVEACQQDELHNLSLLTGPRGRHFLPHRHGPCRTDAMLFDRLT